MPTGAVTARLLEEYPIARGLGIRRLPQEGIPAWHYKYGQIPMTRKSKILWGSQLLFSCYMDVTSNYFINIDVYIYKLVLLSLGQRSFSLLWATINTVTSK